MFSFFLECTEVNTYLSMKYFPKNYEAFVIFCKKFPRHWFATHIPMNNRVSVKKTRKRNKSHIFKDAPTHATKYYLKMGLYCKI